MNILSEVGVNKWAEVLQDFEKISLEDIDPDNLMDRKDRKFLFPEKQLKCFLSKLAEDYLLLSVKGNCISKYETLYLDTDDFLFYNRHHNGSGNRYKIRFRNYADTNDLFFEIKYKNNKRRTVKSRIVCNKISFPLSEEIKSFISEKSLIDANLLEPKLWVNYNRITLINKFKDERITIDTGISLKSDENESDFGPLVIVEVKQSSHIQSEIMDYLRNMRIQQANMSKYCMAVSKLIPNIKKNNFKPHLLYIQKLVHDA